MDGQTRFTGFRRFLAGLSNGQKLAATTIVAVMIASAWWLNGRAPSAAAPGALEPVLDQVFSPAELATITERLQTQSIRCEVRDGKVYVPSDRRLDALSDLYYTDALRGGTEDGFDALVKHMSAWDPPGKTDKLFNRQRELTVQRVIARYAGVRKATVIIDPTSERRMSGSILPTAMVDIQTRGGDEMNSPASRRKLANAAVNVVTGSLANLSRQQVMVTIDGASYGSGGDALAEAGDVLERRQQCEQVYVAKVRQLLSYIPDVLVSVSVDLNVESADREKRLVDSDRSEAAQAAAQPASPQEQPEGLIANAVPMIQDLSALAAAAAAPPRKPAAPASETAQKPRTQAGAETVRSASVAVPRSYFVQIYKRASNKSAEPDDALLQPVVDARAAQIRSLVKNALGLKNDDAVTVEAYDDALSAPQVSTESAAAAQAAAGPVAAATIPSPALLLNAHAREIALVTLGVLALLMLSMVLRRAPVAAQLAAVRAMPPERRERAGLLDDVIEDVPLITAPPERRGGDGGVVESMAGGGEDVIGDVIEGGVHEQEAHHLFRRVREMVNEDPDDAARVLRSWIYEGRR